MLNMSEKKLNHVLTMCEVEAKQCLMKIKMIFTGQQ